MQLAKRLNNFPEYIFSRLNKKIAEVEQQSGRKVLNLGIGSPDFPPSKRYLEKLAEFYREKNAHMYPGYNAIPEFSAAVRYWYKTRFGCEIGSQELTPLLGSKEGIAYLVLALTNPGDAILVPDPGYPSFSATALMFGVKPIFYNLTAGNNFLPEITELEKLVTAKCRFIWLNFPANPTGQRISVEKLKKLTDFARKHSLQIAYDNAYAEISFTNEKPPSILQVNGAREISVELQSFSKTFSFAGFRLGWLAGNEKIVQAVAKIKSQFDSGMSLPLQKLGAFALTNYDLAWREKMLASYRERKKILADKLSEMNLKFQDFQASLYLWAEIPAGYADAETFSLELLEQKQVLMTPGTAFGSNGKNYVRVSICADISKIADYL